jgi:ribokinase
VRFIAKLGRDAYGQAYAHYLRQAGLDTSGLCWDPDLPSGLALITVDRHGHNQITVAPGANHALEPDDLDRSGQDFQPGMILLTQLEIPLTTVEAALRRTKAAGGTTILNPAPARQLPGRFSRLVDVLVPNEIEASRLSGQAIRTLSQARTAARRLQQQGYATVVITLGKNGAVYTHGEQVHHLPGYAVQVADTTAAGDTFVGYLGCALAAGDTLPAAVEVANAAAAISVTRPGAQPSIPWRQEVQQFLTTHHTTTIQGA